MTTLLALALILAGIIITIIIITRASRRGRRDYAALRAELGHDTRTAA